MKRSVLNTLAAGAVLAAAVSAADAALIYELRFADGTSTMNLAPGFTGNVPVTIWARVEGSNGSTSDEALQSGYVPIGSSQVAGGVIDGAITSLTYTAATTPFPNPLWSSTANGARTGTAYNSTPDRVLDWGLAVPETSSTEAADARRPLFRASAPIDSGQAQFFGAGQVSPIDSTDFEFKVGTVNVSITGTSGGEGASTTLRVLDSTFADSVQPQEGVWRSDNQLVSNQDGTTGQLVGFGPGVTFTTTPIPEPAALSLLGLGGLGLLARRRRA